MKSMFRIFVFFLLFLTVSACVFTHTTSNTNLPVATYEITDIPSTEIVPTAVTVSVTKVPPELTQEPTTIPTALTERDQVLLNHEQERSNYIAKHGVAESIPVFELHGDNYFMQFGEAVVELSPQAFEKQMEWLHENEVHAVTGEELILWLKGDIELPSRSIILTFDLGTKHSEARYRVVEVFRKYQMFGIFTILTQNMEYPDFCPDDACWQAFRDAYASGYVTIGSHTMTHRDFALLSSQDGLQELSESKRIIEKRIGQGCVVNILTWPLESVPSWAPSIKDIGFEIAFAGSTYQPDTNAVWRNKPEDFYRLPRVFPPNPDGLSRRPHNKSLQEIMEMYTNGWD